MAAIAEEILRRGLSESQVRRVIDSPEQVVLVRQGRKVFQARVSSSDWDRVYLVRVFVDVDREPAEIVTAYRTSKIAKYSRSGP